MFRKFKVTGKRKKLKAKTNGKCRRSFYVGEDISEEDIHAKFENGILSVTVPKKQALPEVETKKLISID